MNPLLAQLAKTAFAGASAEIKKAIGESVAEVRGGSMRLLMVFETPDGVVQHFRVGMSPGEAMKACVTVHRQIKAEEKAKENGPKKNL